MSGSLTLAVTSSTGVISLAIGRVEEAVATGEDGDARRIEPQVLGEVTIATERRHAEEISPRLQALLAGAGVGFTDLDRLVADVGPGRFTGLRVGLATVRALAFAVDAPVVGLTSLAILAGQQPGPVTAVIDARRNEVFQQTFLDGQPTGEAAVGPAETLAALASGLVIGDGVDRYADHYLPVDGVTVATGRHPLATTMLAMSSDHPARPGTEVHPFYLREPDATPNIKTRASA